MSGAPSQAFPKTLLVLTQQTQRAGNHRLQRSGGGRRLGSDRVVCRRTLNRTVRRSCSRDRMTIPPYNETESIKRYVWRNFPEICRPHECLPHGEDILRLIPDRLKPLCRERLRNRESNQEIDDGDAAIIMAVVTALETKRFMEMVDVESLEIARCPKCRKVLVNENSHQCLHCGFDWH